MSLYKLLFCEYIVFPKLVYRNWISSFPSLVAVNHGCDLSFYGRKKKLKSSFILSFSAVSPWTLPVNVCETMVALLIMVHSEKKKVKCVQGVH